MPTTDDRFHGLTGVWTSQLSDKTVWTTRVVVDAASTRCQSIGPEGALGLFDPEPAVLGREHHDRHREQSLLRHARRLSGRTRRATPRPGRSRATSRAARWKQHTFKTGIEARYNRVQNLGPPAAEHREHWACPGGDALRLHELQPRRRVLHPGPVGVRGSGAERRAFATTSSRPATRCATSDLPSGKRYKQQVSPRLGIAYPISDKDVLSFHYGLDLPDARRATTCSRTAAPSSAVGDPRQPRPRARDQHRLPGGGPAPVLARPLRAVLGVLQGHLRTDHARAQASDQFGNQITGLHQRGLRQRARVRGQHDQELQPQVLGRDELHLPARDRRGVGSQPGAAVLQRRPASTCRSPSSRSTGTSATR